MSVKDTPFNMIVTGTTGCGKTHYFLNFIVRNYKKQFYYIITTRPIFSWKKIMRIGNT